MSTPTGKPMSIGTCTTPMEFICCGIRSLLDHGMEPQELANRLCIVIDAAAEDIRELREEKKRRKERCQ